MTDQHQPDDLYPSDLDELDPGEWASIEAREADLDSEGDSIAEPPVFERQCRRCGALLFTGNTSGLCASCHEQADLFDAVFGAWPAQATATPPEFPWKLDRHVYEAPTMAAWRAEHVR